MLARSIGFKAKMMKWIARNCKTHFVYAMKWLLLVVTSTALGCVLSGVAVADQHVVPNADVFFSSSQKTMLACDLLAKGEFASADRFLQEVDLDFQGEHGVTPLLWCWMNSHHRAFEVLLEYGANPHVRLTADVQVNVSGNKLRLESGSSTIENVIRYCPEQPQFVEKAIRYLRKADEVDGHRRTLFHMLMLATENRPIVRQIRFPKTTDPTQQKVHEIRMDMLKRGDMMRLIQRSSFALLHISGADLYAKNDQGQSPIVAHLDRLGSMPTVPDIPRFEFYLEDQFRWDLSLLFSKTNYLYELGRREELLVAWDEYVKRRVDFGEGDMSSLREAVGQDIKSMLSEAPRFAPDSEFADIGSFPVEDLFSNRYAEKILSSMMTGERPQDLKPQELESLRSDGLDVDAKGKSGVTLLLCSYIMKNHTWFESLIKSGESPIMPLSEDLSEHVNIHWRVSNGIDFCPERGENVLLAIALNPFDRAEYLKTAMQHWRQWNDCDDLGRNVMHRILFHRVPEAQTDLVLELASTGVDLNAQSIGGATPCHIAVFRNASFIPKLVERGADVNVRDFRGLTVLDLLKKSVAEKWTFYEENAKVLEQLQRGQN
jgi:ankyrin repeat protein